MTSLLSCVICHETDPRLRFFHAPQNPERLKDWSELLNGMEINALSIVCEKHFLEEHFTKNLQLNCWRLNRKAIPLLHLMDERVDPKLVNENFNKTIKSPTKNEEAKLCAYVTVTQNFLEYNVDCFYCNANFPISDWIDFMRHVSSKHRTDVESFSELEIVDEMPADRNMEQDTIRLQPPKDFHYDIDEETMEMQAEYYDNNNMETNITIESCPSKYAENAEEVDTFYEIEQYNINDEKLSNLTDDDDTVDEFFKIDSNQQQLETINEMLQTCKENNNQIDIETSDASLVFNVIDSLQAYPALWFINYYDVKASRLQLLMHCAAFSEKFELNMTQTEVHECLSKIHEWYQKIYEEKSFNKLSFPQSEYYRKCAEFLPDKPNGKTCELCHRLFQDHVQYFAHKRLEHATKCGDNEPEDETSLVFLKEHVSDYFRGRYPLKVRFSYDCQICLKKYRLKNDFEEHIKTHLDIRDHVCDICGKSFIRKEKFIVHQKRHQGLNRVQCKICGKEVDNFSMLTAHRRRYHRPLEGTIEELEAMTRKQLRKRFSGRYRLFYEGDRKRFACTRCDKVFQHTSGMHKHFLRFHEDEEHRMKVKNRRALIVEETSLDSMDEAIAEYSD